MSPITTDPNDPRIGKGEGQHEAYLVLTEEERAKGFVRPYRTSYRHVGQKPAYPLRELALEEQERYMGLNYAFKEDYPESLAPLSGRYWTQEQLDNTGCGTVTIMGKALSETYARDPKFYGSTFCCGCQKHLPVAEFVWDKDDLVVGS